MHRQDLKNDKKELDGPYRIVQRQILPFNIVMDVCCHLHGYKMFP